MSAGDAVEEWNPHPLLVEMENGTTTLENRLAMPQKVKVTI